MATAKKTKTLKHSSGDRKASQNEKCPPTYETTDDVAEGNREEVEKSLQHQG